MATPRFKIPTLEEMDKDTGSGASVPNLFTARSSSMAVGDPSRPATAPVPVSRTSTADTHLLSSNPGSGIAGAAPSPVPLSRFPTEEIPSVVTSTAVHGSSNEFVPLERRTTGSGSASSGAGASFADAFGALKESPLYEPPPKTTSFQAAPPGMGRHIIVNPRQKGNPVLTHVKNVPWQHGECVADFLLSPHTAALFLSLRYHMLHRDYIYDRTKEITKFQHRGRILLVLVDVEDSQGWLMELSQFAVIAQWTLIVAWSNEECARYLETMKLYQNKPADLIRGRLESDYASKLTECLTTIRSVNKTDVITLATSFNSLKALANAPLEDLALCPGLGERKVKQIFDAFHEPFRASRRRTDSAPGSTIIADDVAAEATLADVVAAVAEETKEPAAKRARLGANGTPIVEMEVAELE